MLRALNKKEGFTLIELLIVVAIIGILAAIAIPQFAAYRAKAYCSAAKSDLANLAVSQEAYFTDHDVYGGVLGDLSSPAPTGAGYRNSTGVAITIGLNGTSGFNATATHTNCHEGSGGTTGGVFTWNSENGGLVP